MCNVIFHDVPFLGHIFLAFAPKISLPSLKSFRTFWLTTDSIKNWDNYFLQLHTWILSSQLVFDIGEAKIEESKDEKLLGVWVSNELKWSKHLEQLESRFRTYADLGPTQEPFGLVAKKSSIFSQISMAPSNEHPLKK